MADVFDDQSDLVKYAGQMNIINAASFFHLFDWDQQVAVAKRVVELLRPQSDSLLIGRQAGHTESGVRSWGAHPSKAFRHNLDSWKELWMQVGNETNTKWSVGTWAEPWEENDISGHDDGSFRLRFVVRRV